MWHKVYVDLALSDAAGRSDSLIFPVGRHRVRRFELGVLLDIIAPPRVCTRAQIDRRRPWGSVEGSLTTFAVQWGAPALFKHSM